MPIPVAVQYLDDIYHRIVLSARLLEEHPANSLHGEIWAFERTKLGRKMREFEIDAVTRLYAEHRKIISEAAPKPLPPIDPAVAEVNRLVKAREKAAALGDG